MVLGHPGIGKTTFYVIFAILLGIAIAIPVTLYLQYDNGTDKADGWSKWGPTMPFENALYARQRLEAQGQLENTSKLKSWQRFKKFSPNKTCMIALVAGLLLVLIFNGLRLRFPGWPLHPVMFLIWWSWGNMMFFSSFLVGWAIKSIISKYGGAKVYRKIKPFMVGIIAGEITAAFIPMLIGTIYYFITGQPPKSFSVLLN